MKKTLLSISILTLAIALGFTSCNSTPKVAEIELSKAQKLDSLAKYTELLKGSKFIKSFELDSTTAEVVYFQNFAEFKKQKPESNTDFKAYNEYWSTGEATEKALVDGAVRLLLKLDFIDTAKITIPQKDVYYQFSISKSQIEKSHEISFQKFKDQWQEKYSNLYIYKDEYRRLLLSKHLQKL